jgi:superfamily II DNA or RNA helicase
MSASTGSGKSVVMLEMVRNAVEKGSRTIFICERRNLVDQFSAHLDSQGIEHGILMAKHWRFRPEAKVQVASAQTLERMESWPEFSIAFIDEIHASMRRSIITMIEKRPTLKIVGATATPFNPLLAKYFTNVVSAPPMAELVNMGYLVPYRVFIAHEIDTDGVKVVGGEWQKDELETRGRQIVGDIVMDYIRLSNEVFGRKSKAICFSCGIAHGAELAESFAEAGINAIQLASGVDEDFKSEVLREFAKPNSSIDILISVDMLSRGFDQTDIEHVILARPLKKSFSQHVQMIGRGARSHDGKSLCVVQDHAGNWLRFADEWAEFYTNGVSELVGKADTLPKKEPSKQEKERAKCPKCGALWPSMSDTCLHCGHTRVRRNDVSALPGEMRELTGNTNQEKFTSEYKENWYHGMIALLRLRGKNENRAFFLYKEKFGIEPCWKKQSGKITAEVIDYLTMANIKFSKRRV